MIKKIKILIILLVALFLASCSRSLEGTWNVRKYETNVAGEYNVSLKDIGTITFYKDGTGGKNIEYSVMGNMKNDTTPFKWFANKQQITINSDNSEFGKTWIIVERKRKFQKWKSTNGNNQIQILELDK